MKASQTAAAGFGESEPGGGGEADTEVSRVSLDRDW